MSKKIFISGKIRNCEDFEQKFENAENTIRKKFPDAIIVNPVKGKFMDMRHCIQELLLCDSIALINNWCFSENAKLEFKIAEALKLKVIFI